MYCLSANESSTPILVEVSSSNVISPVKTSFPPNYLVEEIRKNMKPSSSECTHCLKHKHEINSLLEKQEEQDRLIFKLKQDYQEKLLTKSPQFVLSNSSSSMCSSSTSLIQEEFEEEKKCEINISSLKRQNSSTATLVSPYNNINNNVKSQSSNIIPISNSTNLYPTSNDLLLSTGYSSGIFNYKNGTGNSETSDWAKYWPSRPQNQPPK